VKPLFSFIIPTFNREDIICEALESVRRELETTNVPAEVLISDDGSSDATQTVVANWCKTNNVEWVFYERLTANKGTGAARNKAIEKAQGSILVFLDSDDQILPGTLLHLKNVFDQQTEMDFYFGAIIKKSGKLGRLPEASAQKRLLNFEDFVGLCGVGEFLPVCRAVLLKNNPHANRFQEAINGFESILWMRLLQRGAKLWIDPRPVRLYDDLRTDRLCHPQNLIKDSTRLALGFLQFFNEFGDAIEIIEPPYCSSLLLRVVFYHKVSNQWSAQLHTQLKPAIGKSSLKVKVLTKVPSVLIRVLYPLFNGLRNSQLLNKLG